MLQHTGHVRKNPNREEQEKRKPSKNVKQPEMMNFGIFQHFFRENVLQAEAKRWNQRTDESNHVEADFR